jgi:hypothetical protein
VTEKAPISIAQRFAHLIGITPPAAASAAAKAEGDDDERKKRDDESDDEHAARVKALDEADEKEKEEAAAKRAKAADEGDDDSDDEENTDDKTKAIRSHERARCAAIIAAAKPETLGYALVLAFGPSKLSRSAAIDLLNAAPAAAATTKKSSLDKRMEGVVVPAVPASPAAKPGTDTAEGLAASIVASGRKALGLKPATA